MGLSDTFVVIILFCFVITGFVQGDTNQQSAYGGTFSIMSDPSGADVFVQGTFIGSTPVLYIPDSTIKVPFSIVFSKTGYQNETKSIPSVPKEGEPVEISAILTKNPAIGSISVFADPSGCLASLNGGKSIPVPYTFSNLPEGSYSVVVSKAGYKSNINKGVIVHPGSDSRLEVTLISNNVNKVLVVTTTPPGADIMVDGIFRGTTVSGLPLTIGPLTDGRHVVYGKLSGYQDIETEVTTKQEESTNLHFNMKSLSAIPTAAVLQIRTVPYGADILMNGIWIGETPVTGYLVLDDVPPNRYNISYVLSGYEPHSEWIYPGQGEVLTLIQNLTPHRGNSSVPSSPSISLPGS